MPNPDRSTIANHPEHTAFQLGPNSSLTFDNFMGKCLNPPAKPLRPSWGLLRWKVERRCRKAGGHWWHPDDSGMIGWFCCQCGAERDGMPKDGQ